MSSRIAPILRVEAEEGICQLTLNRPDSLNAWTPELGRELLHAMRSASSDPEVRAVVLTGAGKAFSSGADLKVPRELTAHGEPDLSSRLREIYNPLILAVRDAPKPVLAAVNGPAAGLGAALALACDLIVAAESSYFLLPFVNLGLIPDAGSAYLLATRVGYSRAAQLAMLGERLPAARAHEWGIVNEVYPDEAFPASARRFAARLAAGPTVAYANMKRLLHAGVLAALPDQLELEAEFQQRHASTGDYAEGVLAFKQKRSPDFTGR